MHEDYVDEYSEYIDFCDPSTREFHCKLGYYTGQKSKDYNVFCNDRCTKDNTEQSCEFMKTNFCKGCNLTNVVASVDWCDKETGNCSCKDGFEVGK